MHSAQWHSLSPHSYQRFVSHQKPADEASPDRTPALLTCEQCDELKETYAFFCDAKLHRVTPASLHTAFAALGARARIDFDRTLFLRFEQTIYSFHMHLCYVAFKCLNPESQCSVFHLLVMNPGIRHHIGAIACTCGPQLRFYRDAFNVIPMPILRAAANMGHCRGTGPSGWPWL